MNNPQVCSFLIVTIHGEYHNPETFVGLALFSDTLRLENLYAKGRVISMDYVDFYELLEVNRRYLTRQEQITLHRQTMAGQYAAARTGLFRILARKDAARRKTKTFALSPNKSLG